MTITHLLVSDHFQEKIIRQVFAYPEFILAFIQTYICTNPTTFMGISRSVKILHKTFLDI